MNETGLSQHDLLSKINSALSAFGLPPWEAGQLGSIDDGQCQVLDMLDFIELGPERLEMTLLISVPGVGVRTTRVRFGGSLISVIPYLVVSGLGTQANGGSVALCKRWRVESGEWSYELPKSVEFIRPDEDLCSPFDSPAHRVVAKIYGQQCTDALTAAKVIPVGRFSVKGESAPGQAFILAAEVARPFPRRKGDGEIVLLKWPNALSLIERGRGITDLLSMSVLLRAAGIFKFV